MAKEITMLNAVTGIGASDIKKLPAVMKDFAYQSTTTGSPTTATLDLEGSLDGTTFSQLGTANHATSGTYTAVVDKPVLYVRLNLTALSGGSSPTVTAKLLVDDRLPSKIGRGGEF